MMTTKDPDLADPSKVIPQMKASFDHPSTSASKLKATWLGHACYLLEFPAEKEGGKGVTVLLDPVFSQRCSPFTFMGPSRYTRESWGGAQGSMMLKALATPCTVKDLPEVDVVVRFACFHSASRSRASRTADTRTSGHIA
jgi:N-acyl-phosphatidylethanolamine-hydrolysing phospholipase D